MKDGDLVDEAGKSEKRMLFPPLVEKKPALLLALALLGAILGTYLPALEAGFVWNDNTYVTDNQTLNSADGLRMIWTEPASNEQYYPLVFTSYWLEKRLWGLYPLGYHLVNVLLHAGAALLLASFLRRLLLPGAWLAAALFALHPVCVESVAWVTERKNTFSLVLTLLAAHAWLSWREASAAREQAPIQKKKRRAGPVEPWFRRSAPLYAAALAAFTLSLFAKTTASVLPAVLLVLVWWKEGRLGWKDVRRVLPFFGIGIALAIHTAWLERTMVQATGQEWALSLPGHLVLAGRSVAFYAGKFLFPSGLAFIYPRWTIDPSSAFQWIPAAGAAAALVLAFVLRSRIGRGPLAALLLFGGVLFPAMGFFNVYAMRFSWVADHFAYQAVAVAAAAAVCGGATLLAGTPVAMRRAAAGLVVAVIAFLGTVSWRQCHVYQDVETLWKDTLAKNPDSFMSHTNYGYWLHSVGRTDEAIGHFEQSLRIKPDNVPTLLNLARIEEERGNLEKAADHVRAARQVDPSDPVVRLNLATIYTKAGRPEEAVQEYLEALRFPSSSDYLVHNGLGAALMSLGRPAEAIEHFRTTVRLRPDYEHGRANLERALAMVGGAR
jgi:tetratricopeptide (TPR) repeat protein